MCPPPRNLALEANDCFMVQVPPRVDRTEYKVAAQGARAQAPLGSPVNGGGMRRRQTSLDRTVPIQGCVKTRWLGVAVKRVRRVCFQGLIAPRTELTPKADGPLHV